MKLGHGCLFYASNWRVSILFALSLSLRASPAPIDAPADNASLFFLLRLHLRPRSGPARRYSKEPGVRGIARVCKEGYPDYNAWDPKHPYV